MPTRGCGVSVRHKIAANCQLAISPATDRLWPNYLWLPRATESHETSLHPPDRTTTPRFRSFPDSTGAPHRSGAQTFRLAEWRRSSYQRRDPKASRARNDRFDFDKARRACPPANPERKENSCRACGLRSRRQDARPLRWPARQKVLTRPTPAIPRVSEMRFAPSPPTKGQTRAQDSQTLLATAPKK